MKNALNSIFLVCCVFGLLPLLSMGQEGSNEEASVLNRHQIGEIVERDNGVTTDESNDVQNKSREHGFFSNKNQLSYSTSFLGDGRFYRHDNFLMSQIQYSRVFRIDSSNWFVKAGLGFFPVFNFSLAKKVTGINFSTPVSVGYAFNRFHVALEYVPYMVIRFGLDKQLAKQRRQCLNVNTHPFLEVCDQADRWILPFEVDHFAFMKVGYTSLNGFGGEVGLGLGRICGHSTIFRKVTVFATRFQLNYNF